MIGEGGDAGDDSALVPSEKDAKAVLDTAEDVSRVETRGRAVGVAQSTVDLRLQKWVGYGGLGLMVAQLVVANLVFVKHAHEMGWGEVAPAVLQVYFASTVVQVIGVVYIVARSVFPEGGRAK